MKRKATTLKILVLGGVLLLLGMSACGDGETGIGMPGFEGGESGALILIDEIDLEEDGYSVDGVQMICSGGDVEEFTDDYITITFTNSDRPTATGLTATDVVLEYYTIEYRRTDTDSNPAPSLPTVTKYLTAVIPANGELEADIYLVDLQTKSYWSNYFLSWYYGDIENENVTQPDWFDQPTRYTAVYTFYGQTIHGEHISFNFSISFTMGNFDNC